MSRKKKGTKKFIKAVSVSVIGASSSAALAGPSGGSVAAGTISIGSMSNNEQVITQSSAKGIINWSDFSINAGELVRFAQQAGNDSITLNRVLGSQVSNIQGALQANGNIFLINPNGIVFGSGSTVDVAGLLATTFNVSDSSFTNGGELSFTQVANKDLASITNQGHITAASNGFVYLVAPKVDNSGYVIANVGRVTMAAGDRFTVNLQGSNLINFSVSADTLAAASGDSLNGVKNSGKVSAQTVLLQGNSASGLMSSVVNNTGIIEATDLNIKAGDIAQSGTIKGVGNGVAAATTATLSASKTITTAGNGSSTRATTLNLSVTGEGASLGAEGGALRVDADVLNATAQSGHVLVTDVNGGVALNTVKAGSDEAGGNVVISALNGSITSADTFKTNVSGRSAKLVADGAIGTDTDAVNTKVGGLSASTQNGGINVKNTGALILGDVIAREQISVNGNPSTSGAVDTSGSITLSDGSTGSKNVKVQTSQGLIFTGTVSATNGLTLTSDTANLLAAQDGTQLIGRTLTLSAGGEIGDAARSLSIQSNTVNAAAGNGGVFLTESNGLTIDSLAASGTNNNVSLKTTQGNITVGNITANGGTVGLNADNGTIVATGSGTNVTAKDLKASSKSGIGASNKAIATSVDTITATTTAAQAGAYLSNVKALTKLSVTTPNGDTNIAFTGGSLIYNRNLATLSLNRTQALDLSFANTASGMKLNGIDAGADQNVALTAAGDITQGSGNVVGKKVAIDASGNVGTADTALQTKASQLDLTSRNGIVNVNNTSSDLSLTAKARATNGAVTMTQTGNLAVNSVVAKQAVTLNAGGAVTTDAAAVSIPVSAGSLSVTAASIGTSTKALASQVANGAVSLTATGGDINYSNVGAISLLNVLASNGKIAFQNSGDAVVDLVKAGSAINFKVSGNVTDGNGSAANFITSGLTAAVKSFGTVGDAMEIQVDNLVIDAANGGIYARQSNGNLLSLVQATSGGSGSDIQIAADGSIKLGNVNAGGNNVKISAAGGIEDGRSDTTAANVVARSLDISAPGGVGRNGSLALDVSFLSAAGGSNGVTATNAGAVAVNSSSLVGKGASAISIIATSITVLDNNGGTTTMDNGGTLMLKATSGNIVFLNQNDTIYLPGGGSITLIATSRANAQVPGYDGVIIAGNLKTDGGDITLQAQSNITIGMLDAGTTGNVTVASAGGVILDGNGAAQNIKGNRVSLTASTPNRRSAELTRDTAIAEYSARDAEAAAKLLQLNILIQQLKDYEALVTSATLQNSLAELTQRLAEASANAQSAKVDQMSGVADGLNTALNAATVVRNAAAVIAGAAQAVPFSGDAGADAAFAVVDLVMSAATLALDSYERYTLAPEQDKLVELNNNLDVANAAIYTAATNLATTTAIRDTTATSKATADLAVFKANTARDAALQVRKQAVAGYDLNQQIDSSADKPLGITANRLDINNGDTIDSSLYLNSTGSLGLGNVTVAAGQKIAVDASTNVGVVGTVKSDTSIDFKAGQAILGQGGTLVTPDLKMVAGNGIGANQAVNTQTSRVAADAGVGSVAIVNANGGALLTIGTQGAVKGISGAGDISITTDGSLNIEQLVKDSTHTHTVSLTSTNGSISDGNTVERNVQGGTLVARAAGPIDVDTEVDTLDVEVRSAGNVAVREANAVNARNVKTANGNIDVKSNGAMVVGSLAASTGTIDLRAGGAVDDDQDDSTLIVAKNLNIQAAGSVGATGSNTNRHLDTKVEQVSVTASGDVNLAEVDDLTVGTLETDQGNVTVTTGGTLGLGSLTTGTASDTVTLVAGNKISNARTDGGDNISTANLALSAAQGIGADKTLNVKAAHLEAHADTGSIKIKDLDGDLVIGGVTPNLGHVAISGVNTNGGNIEVGTVGNLTVDEGVINTAAGKIDLQAGGNLQQNVNVQTANGDLSVGAGSDLTMLSGTQAISQGTGNVTYSAGQNANLERVTTNSGKIELATVIGDLTQNALVQTGAGNITAKAGRDLLMASGVHTKVLGSGNISYSAGRNASLEQLTTNGGNIALSAAQGNLTQHKLVQTGTGDITASAAGNLTTEDTTAVLGAGNINYSAGGNASLQQMLTGSGNIELATAIGDLTQNALVQTGAGNITAKAGRDLLMASGVHTKVLGSGNISYSAGRNASLEQLTTNGGNIALSAAQGNLTQHKLVQTGTGDITASAAGNLTTEDTTAVLGAGNINYSAGGNASLQQMLTGSGNIELATVIGDLTQNALVQTGAGNITAKAGRDLLMASGVHTKVLGSGNISYSAGRNASLEQLTTTVGNITLSAAQGNLTQHKLVQTGAGDITASAAGNLTTEDTTAVLGAGNINYSAGGNASLQQMLTGSGNIELATVIGDLTQNALVQTGAGNITAKAGRDLLMASGVHTKVLGSGNVSYTAGGNGNLENLATDSGNVILSVRGNLVQSGSVATTAGNLSADALGDLTMNVGSLAQVMGQGNVNYSAGGNLLLDQVRTANGDVQLTAKAGDIQVQGSSARNITAKQLTANAAGNIGTNDPLRTDVDTLVATATNGSIMVNEGGALTIDTVVAANGKVAVSAGDVAIKQLQGADVVLNSSGQVVTVDGGLVKGGTLDVNAVSGVNLHTALDRATVSVNGTGGLALTEDDGITLARLNTADGDISINAGGNIGVNSVDAGNRNVSLTSSSGSIVSRLLAQVAQLVGISGNRIELNAATGLGNDSQGSLQLQGNTLAARTALSDVNLSQSKSAVLEQIGTGNGNLQVSVANGDAVLGQISASGKATLSADNGRLVDDGNAATRVQSNDLNLTSRNGIGVQTQASRINAQVSESGSVDIDELDGLDRLTVNSASGDVAAVSRTGNLEVDVINANGHSVSLNAGGGAIHDANNNAVSNVSAESANLIAASGIGQVGNPFEVNVRTLSVNAGNGGAFLNSTSTTALDLGSLSAAQGDIALTTAGDLNVKGTVNNRGAGNIFLSGANVTQRATIATSGLGNVTVKGTGNVAMDSNAVTTTDSGTVSYQGGQSIQVGSVQTSNANGGGKVIFVAPQVLDNMPGVANVRAWQVSLNTGSRSDGLVEALVGDVNQSARIDLGSRVIGGSLAESRRFMEALLQPTVMKESGVTPNLFNVGVVSPQQFSVNKGFVERDDGVMIYNN
ncbi:two-partner secretion domain-containing protein [Pseudomonas oryzihabitans]|uniref:two-partner secretion domain-containing protein n=1 Tax=Pseudomonas oryzihabitans TaxID=47885 RepID=UPI001124B1F4|nr:filamentous hemagglutinin N-terminal domain-containing protein [Pseudomonas psychrotolerans]QDD91745.1 filamentous hemagglutinin [Pseudomonas psychrotolerans]